MSIPRISEWAKIKGLKLVGTGDFTHPLWFSEIKKFLKEANNGLYKYDDTHFMLTAEVSNIFNRKSSIKKIHNIIFTDSIENIEKINSRLKNYGDLASDGRPILSLDTIDLVKIIMDISENSLIIPAHAWTPHFSLFGSNSGFDSVEECFGEQTEYIYSIETGLSSDPKMNWRLSELDKYTLVSNSDAHSPSKLGREANCFSCRLDYYEIINAIKTQDKEKFLFTIEFYPEEGKYHYDGHRNCKISLHPRETKNLNYICPICGKKLTIGVLHRVEELSDRAEGYIRNTIGYKNLIPLEEIIADTMNMQPNSAKVKEEYFRLISNFGNEFEILLNVSIEDLEKYTSSEIANGIIKARNGDVDIIPGYDGVYGKISIRKKAEVFDTKIKQLELF